LLSAKSSTNIYNVVGNLKDMEDKYDTRVDGLSLTINGAKLPLMGTCQHLFVQDFSLLVLALFQVT
jgi:hypothetical protein